MARESALGVGAGLLGEGAGLAAFGFGLADEDGACSGGFALLTGAVRLIRPGSCPVAGPGCGWRLAEVVVHDEGSRDGD